MRFILWATAICCPAHLVASPVFALEPKQCLSMVDMNAALKAEGQRTLIFGDRVTLRNDANRESGLRVERWVNIFTSSDDGSLGYNLEGDRATGQPSKQVCVRSKLTNFRVYDARKPGTPPGARRGGQFDQVLRDDEALGTRPMMQADTISAGEDGTAQRGLSVTLQGNVARRSAMLMAHHPDGQARDMFMMENVAYTPVALQRLN